MVYKMHPFNSTSRSFEGNLSNQNHLSFYAMCLFEKQKDRNGSKSGTNWDLMVTIDSSNCNSSKSMQLL